MQTDEKPIRMLALALTGRCNFACRYCYAAYQDQRMMTEETAIAAVKMAEKSGLSFTMQFTGGEPLLNFPVLRAAARYAETKKLPARMQIQTNGSLLTREIASWLYQHKIAIGLSLDGRPAVNDRLRKQKDGTGAADAISRGFRVLAEEGVGTGITCVVTDENADVLEGIADMAFFYGNVRRIGFDILRHQGRGTGLSAPLGEAMERALERVRKRVGELHRMTGIPVSFSQEERARVQMHGASRDFGHCYSMNGEAAFVDAGGNIYACSSLMGDPAFFLGTVQDGRDPDKVEDVCRKVYEAMEECRKCPDFTRCGGGCFARWYGEGTVARSDAECALKRFFIRSAEGL